MKDERAGADGAGRDTASAAFLAELLTREQDADGLRAAWRASGHFGRDAALDRELDELCRLREGLARSGRAAREVLEQASARSDARAEALVERFLRERLGGAAAADAAPPRRPSARRWALVSVAAALAASLLVVLALRRDAGSGELPELWLGADQTVELLAPRGACDGWETFRWRTSGRSDVWYELVVSAPDGRELARVEGLRGEHWRPPADAAWPARIRWRLSAFDADGRLGTWSADAWLR